MSSTVNVNKMSNSSPRWFAGIHITTDCCRIEAALIGVHGRGNGAPIECRQSMAFDLPSEIVDSYHEILAAKTLETDELLLKKNLGEQYAALVAELASVEEEALDELVTESRISKHDLVAVGLFDPGLWDTPKEQNGQHENQTPGVSRVFRSLSCPDQLAERTGISVIDSFPSRDIACGGVGGPLSPFPSWIVLCSEEKDRVLIDLGKTARWTYLPQPTAATSYEKIEYREICPCGSLLDALTHHLTRGKTQIDNGGHLTVQGQQIPALAEHWKTLLASEPQPLWMPYGIPATAFLNVVLEKALQENWAVRDQLCTAAYFIAETIADELEKRFPSTKDPEILLTGGGCRHGLLLNQLGKRLGERPKKMVKDCGVQVDSFAAVCVAILTLFFVDQIPQGIQSITGAQTARTLGRVTPGSPQNWSRLLDEILQGKSPMRPLRSAM